MSVISKRVGRAQDSKDDETENRKMRPKEAADRLAKFPALVQKEIGANEERAKSVAKHLKKAAKKIKKAAKDKADAGEK